MAGRCLLLLLLLLLLTAAPSWAQERIQIGLYRPEEPLQAPAAPTETAPPPTVDSVQWDSGDLRIRVVQSAPCGEFFPADASADRKEAAVTLRWRWEPQRAGERPKRLCRRHVEAWVFDAPEQRYEVRFADAMARYGWRGGEVVLLAP